MNQSHQSRSTVSCRQVRQEMADPLSARCPPTGSDRTVQGPGLPHAEHRDRLSYDFSSGGLLNDLICVVTLLFWYSENSRVIPSMVPVYGVYLSQNL